MLAGGGGGQTNVDGGSEAGDGIGGTKGGSS